MNLAALHAALTVLTGGVMLFGGYVMARKDDPEYGRMANTIGFFVPRWKEAGEAAAMLWARMFGVMFMLLGALQWLFVAMDIIWGPDP